MREALLGILEHSQEVLGSEIKNLIEANERIKQEKKKILHENEHFKIDYVAPQDILRSFMTEHGLTQSAIAEISGEYESNLSAFLAGKRNLSKQAAKQLGEHFAVDPMIFLPRI